MKVIKEEAINPANEFKASPFVVLYNKKTGKPKEFHTIDVPEILSGYSHEWSQSPVAIEQEKAEDAVIVKQLEKEPIKPKAETIKPVEAEPDKSEVKEPEKDDKTVSARSRKRK